MTLGIDISRGYFKNSFWDLSHHPKCFALPQTSTRGFSFLSSSSVLVSSNDVRSSSCLFWISWISGSTVWRVSGGGGGDKIGKFMKQKKSPKSLLSEARVRDRGWEGGGEMEDTHVFPGDLQGLFRRGVHTHSLPPGEVRCCYEGIFGVEVVHSGGEVIRSKSSYSRVELKNLWEKKLKKINSVG